MNDGPVLEAGRVGLWPRAVDREAGLTLCKQGQRVWIGMWAGFGLTLSGGAGSHHRGDVTGGYGAISHVFGRQRAGMVMALKKQCQHWRG